MPLIKHLSDVVCPECHSGICKEWVETKTSRHFNGEAGTALRTHCNTQQFEHRQFICGCVISWIPNYDRMEVTRQCPDNKELRAKRERKQNLEDSLLNFIRRETDSKTIDSFTRAQVSTLVEYLVK